MADIRLHEVALQLELDERKGQERWARRIWWAKRVAWLLAPVVLLLIVWVIWLVTAEFRYARAVEAIAKEQKPWRFEEIVAARAPVPDAENAALAFMKAHAHYAKLRAEALGRLAAAADASGADTDPQVLASQEADRRGREADFERELNELNPAQGLTPEVIAFLSERIDPYEPAIAELRAVANLSRGRYPLPNPLPPNLWTMILTGVQESREVARLLMNDATLRAERGEIDGALESARALVAVGRATGDDPMMICQLIRIAELGMATEATERALAQGEPTDAVLARLQADLRRAEADPVLEWALRGERGSTNHLFDAIVSGQLKPSQFLGMTSVGASPGSWVDYLPLRPWFRQGQAVALEHLTKALEISRLPEDEQISAWGRWEGEIRSVNKVLDAPARLTLPAVSSMGESCHRSKGMLRALIAVIALERQRLAQGTWPEFPVEPGKGSAALPVLDPAFGAPAQTDPFSGEALRIAPFDGGYAIYSVGRNREDDRGNLFGKDGMTNINKADFGVRWYRPDRRRQPPAAGEASN